MTNLQAQRRCKPPIVIPCRSEPERLIRWLTTSETEPTPYELGPVRVTARAGSGQAVRSRRQKRAAFWVQKKAGRSPPPLSVRRVAIALPRAIGLIAGGATLGCCRGLFVVRTEEASDLIEVGLGRG